ncbi:MAG: polyketide cyclase [Thaumarchaeota archaeon]|nr:polyketide cyclase [Nitrososphaerota archaeon]
MTYTKDGEPKLPKITIIKNIKAERQHTFDVIANYEKFQDIVPKYYPSIRVRSMRENIAIVEEHMKLGDKELIMTTKHITKYPESHDIFVLGGDIKGTHISEIYEKTEQGTKLTIIADIKLNGIMKLASIFGKSKVVPEFNKVIDEFCKIAES